MGLTWRKLNLLQLCSKVLRTKKAILRIILSNNNNNNNNNKKNKHTHTHTNTHTPTPFPPAQRHGRPCQRSRVPPRRPPRPRSRTARCPASSAWHPLRDRERETERERERERERVLVKRKSPRQQTCED